MPNNISNEFMNEMWKNVQAACPLVHAITNYVTVNDCANALLAAGASPIMADDADEVAEITALCSATVLNIGTLNRRTIDSMLLAGREANRLNHPLVLDPVGAGASTLRTETARQLLNELKFTVIRGNISEIKTLAVGSGQTMGVDAALADQITDANLPDTLTYLKAFSRQTGAVIAVSGAIDIITDGSTAYICRNGHPAMSKITGTGCMLTCLTAAYAAANPQNVAAAVATAFTLMGLAGENAASITPATGSIRANILDNLATLGGEDLKAGGKIVKM